MSAPTGPLRVRPPVQAPQLLALDDAASRLAIAPRTLREWASQGRLPFARFGRSLRFREEDLARLVTDAMVGGKGAP